MESKTAVGLCKSEAVGALRGMLCKLCPASSLSSSAERERGFLGPS